MIKLLKKELKLSTAAMTYIFLVFVFLTLVPNYPVLLSAFFVSLGIFQSFHQARATNDILYTVLLPIKKSDVVRSKLIMVCFFEIVGFIFLVVLSMIRMFAWKDAPVYRDNPLMNTNLVFLGFCLLIFLAFNLIFVRGFFKTADKITKPYLLYILVSVIIIIIGEMLHFFPALRFLNDNLGEASTNVSASASGMAQLIILVICILLYVFGTILAWKLAAKHFEKLVL